MLAVYTFVFGGVFNARWGDGGGMKDFVQMLFSGLIVFYDTLSRSPIAVLSNPIMSRKWFSHLNCCPLAISLRLYLTVYSPTLSVTRFNQTNTLLPSSIKAFPTLVSSFTSN